MSGITNKGWELLITRLRVEKRNGVSRTVGRYQLYNDGVALDGIAGYTCEPPGPGDNSHMNGKRIEPGRYPVWTQEGEKYCTIDYARGGDIRERPRPGIEMKGTGGREEILIHPGSVFLSSIGCINLSQKLDDADDDIDYNQSYAAVVSLIETLKGYLGPRFPKRDGKEVPDAAVCVEGEPSLEASVFEAMAVFTAPTTAPTTISKANFAAFCSRPGAGGGRTVYDGYIDAFTSARGIATLGRYGVTDNIERQIHFFAQAAHETGGFTLSRESLTYTTVKAIRKAWKSRALPYTDAWITANLLKQPETLGDWAYGGRMGNRKGTRDGYDFRGGGVFQTTGREAFEAKGKVAGVDLIAHPELIDDPQISLITALAEWNALGCNALADADNGKAISRGINIGNTKATMPANGEAERLASVKRLRAIV